MPFKCKYTVEQIEDLDWADLCEILDENEIQYENLETIEETKELLLKHFHENTQRNIKQDETLITEDKHTSAPLSTKSGANLMDNIITQDLQKKNELCKIYGELHRFFHKRPIDVELIQELETAFQNYEDTLKRHPKELTNEECPIVVAGETSAGKSSILNLLLESEILPHSLLCSTSTICRLRHSDTKRVTVTRHGENNAVQLKDVDQSTDGQKLKLMIQDYVSVQQNRADNPYEYVDIYWPVPMLKKHVIIVDTPGIGEDPRMTERLLSYLPKAVGFIYVINSANAGGVQSDRLLKIFEYLHAEEVKGKSAFDYRCALFVCNKWDQVSEEESEKVWKDTRGKLKANWPLFDEETQLFKMSAQEVTRRVSSGLAITKKYEKFLQAVERIIPSSLDAKIMRHILWLKRFLKKLMYLVVARINASKTTAEEKEKKRVEVEARIKILQDNMKQVKEEVSIEAENRCQLLANQLHRHLLDPITRSRMIKWPPPDQLPDGSDMEVIKYKSVKLIIGLIETEIHHWCQQTQVSKVTDNLASLFKEKCNLLQEQCDNIDKMILGAGDPLDALPEVDVRDESAKKKSESLFTRQEKIAMAIFAPLFLPLVVAAGIVALPVGIGVAIKDAVLDRKRVSAYRENKLGYLSKLVDEVLSQYTYDAIFQSLQNSYLSRFNRLLENLCNDEIPKQINVDIQLITHITNDIRESELIRRVYEPLERDCKIIEGQFLLVLTQYFDKHRIDSKNVEKGREIASGSFSTVYKAKVFMNGEWIDAAMKEMRHPLDGEFIYTQLTEVKYLWKFNHENVVKLFGVSFREGDRKRFLNVLMEMCDETLENRVIVSRENRYKPCSSFKLDSPDILDPFAFFCKMALDICSGLEYIHSLGFIHRDLKLSNVLLKEGVAKLADVGFAKPIDMLTGSLAGTPTHMAPEVMLGKLYDKSADIYSLAIMLWEMWYGARAYSGPEYHNVQSFHNLVNHVKNGDRPRFVIHKPWFCLEHLIVQSWDPNAEDRPSVTEIKNAIMELKEAKC